MARPKVRPKPTQPQPKPSALRLRQPAEAIAALLRERSQLLERIAKTERDLVREREQQRELGDALFERMQPLMSERSSLRAEVQALFGELLTEGRLSRSARRKVADVYAWLVENGEIDPPEPAAEDARHSKVDWFFEEEEEAEFGSREPQSQPGLDSARHAGGRPGNDILRALVRRLAMALHPDLVQDETDRQRRTDIMKEVTRAYEEGNLARLLEIEQLWLSGGNVASAPSDEAARCAELERTIRELQAQLKTRSSELRALRKNSPLAPMFGTRRASDGVRRQQMETLMAAASAELDPLRQLRDFVRAFSERRISLAEFLRGPQTPNPDDIDLAAMMLEFMASDLGIDLGDLDVHHPKRARSRSSVRRRKSSLNDDPTAVPWP